MYKVKVQTPQIQGKRFYLIYFSITFGTIGNEQYLFWFKKNQKKIARRNGSIVCDNTTSKFKDRKLKHFKRPKLKSLNAIEQTITKQLVLIIIKKKL